MRAVNLAKTPRASTLVLMLAAAVAGAGCASTPDPSRYTIIDLPDYNQFAGIGLGPGNAGVHVFLEVQCGTLDCHGQLGRPFRLFAQNGLRAANDAGNVAGGNGETPDELYANYVSLVGLEPEEMSRVVAGDDVPTHLLVVKKPRGIEGHKGGVRMLEGDPLDLCLTSWLGSASGEAQFDQKNCTAAANIP